MHGLGNFLDEVWDWWPGSVILAFDWSSFHRADPSVTVLSFGRPRQESGGRHVLADKAACSHIGSGDGGSVIVRGAREVALHFTVREALLRMLILHRYSLVMLALYLRRTSPRCRIAPPRIRLRLGHQEWVDHRSVVLPGLMTLSSPLEAPAYFADCQSGRSWDPGQDGGDLAHGLAPGAIFCVGWPN